MVKVFLFLVLIDFFFLLYSYRIEPPFSAYMILNIRLKRNRVKKKKKMIFQTKHVEIFNFNELKHNFFLKVVYKLLTRNTNIYGICTLVRCSANKFSGVFGIDVCNRKTILIFPVVGTDILIPTCRVMKKSNNINNK